MTHDPDSANPSTDIAASAHALWSSADDINQKISNIRDYARILAMAGEGVPGDDGEGDQHRRICPRWHV